TLPPTAKFFKYLMLILLVGIATLVVTQILMKGIWGRARPNQVDDITVLFTPWWVIQDTGWKSFWSGHTAQATIMTTLVFSFLGSRKRWLAPVLGVAVAFYVFMMGLGRIASNHHWLSDNLFGGFVVYTLNILVYYLVLNIPTQEKIFRYKLANAPFNEGYSMVLAAKGMLKEKPAEALDKVSAGLQLFAKARDESEQLVANGYKDYQSLVDRIDDLSTRFGTLMQEYQSLPGKSGPALDAWAFKWSYVC
nr:phosphatase PAP2 family protein [Candidatus Sigynarchaeota archaeon]